MKVTKDENVKTIRFPVKTDEKLTTIANKSGLTKLNFFIYMVDYFYKSKKDPRDLNDELLKNAINKKTDNIVAFIKTQEQELLIPLKKDAEKNLKVQGTIVEYFNLHIIKRNEEQKAANQELQSNLSQIAGYLQKLDKLQYDKNTLKKKFSEILEYYVRQREQMGMLTKQEDKNELIAHIRNQLQNL